MSQRPIPFHRASLVFDMWLAGKSINGVSQSLNIGRKTVKRIISLTPHSYCYGGPPLASVVTSPEYLARKELDRKRDEARAMSGEKVGPAAVYLPTPEEIREKCREIRKRNFEELSRGKFSYESLEELQSVED